MERNALAAPLYQQIADHYEQSIMSGALEAGHKLPTVRAYARENGIALGTIKHAYDILEQRGCIERVQGRGTFVSDIKKAGALSKKDRAMAAIDALLDRMYELSFTPEETRIFFDLKLRERAGQAVVARIGVVDCNKETLAAISAQIASFPNADVVEYPLQAVLDAPREFRPDVDLVVTSSTHFEELKAKTAEDARVLRLSVAISRAALLRIARIPEGSRVGIIAATKRFASIVQNSLKEYALLSEPPEVALLNDLAAVEAVVDRCDTLILPSNYLRYCSGPALKALENLAAQEMYIPFEYRLERGSLLALEDEISKIVRQKQRA